MNKIILISFIIILLFFILFTCDNAYTKYSMEKRRNIPAKKRKKILTEILDIIYTAAARSNTSPFLLYGTLLGQVRNNDLICYDFDIDVGIMDNEYETIKYYIQQILKNNCKFYLRIDEYFNYKKFVIVHKETGLNGDIFNFIMKNNRIYREFNSLYITKVLKQCMAEYPVDWIFPLQSTNFKGHRVFIPNKSDKLLTCIYGEKYISPDYICDINCEKCEKVE